MYLYIHSIQVGPVTDCECNVTFLNPHTNRWSKTPAHERARLMNKIADLVETRLDEFAIAESRDQGKPVWLAKAVDIPRLCHNFRFFASAIMHTIDT